MAFSVYELVNDRLQEIFVGLAEGPSAAELSPASLGLRQTPAGWLPAELREGFRVVESFPDRGAAERFFLEYSSRTPPRGWSIVREKR